MPIGQALTLLTFEGHRLAELEYLVPPSRRVGTHRRVVRSLDKRDGLDDEAVKALKQWQFTPGKKDGINVPVVIEVEMSFSVGKVRQRKSDF